MSNCVLFTTSGRGKKSVFEFVNARSARTYWWAQLPARYNPDLLCSAAGAPADQIHCVREGGRSLTRVRNTQPTR